MIVIRLASEKDAAILARLRLELRSASHMVVENEQEFLERCESWMNERPRKGSQWQCWIAEREAIVLGAVWAQLIEKIPNPAVEGECYIYVTNFYVREEYRGKGIGSRLLSEVLAWAKTKNAHTAILWPRERSKSLYLRHGFSAADDLMRLVVEQE